MSRGESSIKSSLTPGSIGKTLCPMAAADKSRYLGSWQKNRHQIAYIVGQAYYLLNITLADGQQAAFVPYAAPMFILDARTVNVFLMHPEDVIKGVQPIDQVIHRKGRVKRIAYRIVVWTGKSTIWEQDFIHEFKTTPMLANGKITSNGVALLRSHPADDLLDVESFIGMKAIQFIN